jgi:hypothetical protein
MFRNFVKRNETELVVFYFALYIRNAVKPSET